MSASTPGGGAGAPGRSPRPPQRGALAPEYWAALHGARRGRKITAGALQFAYTLARLAAKRGDGASLVIGTRLLAVITGEARTTIRRHLQALQAAGLLLSEPSLHPKHTRRLAFVTPDRAQNGPGAPGPKWARSIGPKMGPTLYREESSPSKDDLVAGKAESAGADESAPEKVSVGQGKASEGGDKPTKPQESRVSARTKDVKDAPVPPDQAAAAIRAAIERLAALKSVAPPPPYLDG